MSRLFFKNLILKEKKFEFYVFIYYLISYDFINIFRVRILSHIRIVRTRNVFFDKIRFYNLAKLNLSYLLIINVKNTLKVLKISNNIFFETIIKKKHQNQLINHIKNESSESWFENSKTTTNFQINLKNSSFMISKMNLEKNQENNNQSNTIKKFKFNLNSLIY